MGKLKGLIANWKTSLMSIVPIVLSLLLVTGIIDLEKQQALQEAARTTLDGLDVGLNGIIAAIAAAIGGIGLFAKDGE